MPKKCTLIKTRRLTKSDRAPPNVLAVSFVSLKISIKQCIQRMCFGSQIFRKQGQIPCLKVMLSNERSCQKEYTEKYESPTTYQSTVMTKVRVFFKNRSNSEVKGQRVKVMVSNERSHQKEYTCEI